MDRAGTEFSGRGVWTNLTQAPRQRMAQIHEIAAHLVLPSLKYGGYRFSPSEIALHASGVTRRQASALQHRFAVDFLQDPEEFAEVCLRLRLADGTGASKHVGWSEIDKADGERLNRSGAFCLLIGSTEQPIGLLLGRRSIVVGGDDENCTCAVTYELDLKLLYVATEHRGLFNSHALTLAVEYMAREDMDDIARQIEAGPRAATLNAVLHGEPNTPAGLAAAQAIHVALNEVYADEGGPQQPVGRRYLGYKGCQEEWEI